MFIDNLFLIKYYTISTRSKTITCKNCAHKPNFELQCMTCTKTKSIAEFANVKKKNSI